MPIVNVYLQNEHQKEVLVSFLNSLGYTYTIDDDLTENDFKEIAKRKADFIAGKTTSRPWSEIKKDYKLPKP